MTRKNKVRCGPLGSLQFVIKIQDKTKNKVPIRSAGSLQFVIKIKGIFFPKDKVNLNQRLKGFLPKRQSFSLADMTQSKIARIRICQILRFINPILPAAIRKFCISPFLGFWSITKYFCFNLIAKLFSVHNYKLDT